jgi:hypothetical protein
MARFFSILALFAFAAASVANPIDPEARDVGVEKRDFTGRATWAYQGLGACGIVTKDTDLVTGVSAQYFDSYPYVPSTILPSRY